MQSSAIVAAALGWVNKGRRRRLESQRQELEHWTEEQAGKTSAADQIPGAVKSFLEDFQRMEPRIQKAHLQTILKAAHVNRDNTIELEFRS